MGIQNEMGIRVSQTSFILFLVVSSVSGLIEAGAAAETLAELGARLGTESQQAYEACPYSFLSKDYFARFSRDPEAKPGENETLVTDAWYIVLDDTASPLAQVMAEHLADFLKRAMGVALPIRRLPTIDPTRSQSSAIVLLDSNGGARDLPESFTVLVGPDSVRVLGRDPEGLRDGVVKLVEMMGLRQAPILPVQIQVYKPRLPVRLGAVPWLGSYRDLVFMGYNAVMVSGGSLYALSESDAIPELVARRQPGALEGLRNSVAEARKYGLKTFCMMEIRQKFDRDDPVFVNHPEIRGALTWKADGQYVLCTEHPLVRQFLSESMAGVFRAAPDLNGVTIIIGGEGFYHCFMRPFGVEKGHTNCPRCEPLGAETVVANLCNTLAEAARGANPAAEILAWPYSAEHVWSKDKAQADFIRKLKPGTGIFTEIEKDEYVQKTDGVRKHLWDYSIDLIGPGERAKAQIAACREVGIPIYMKSEPELGFEAPRLPHIPCLDRWVERADALASCGVTGAWVFPAFRPCYGASAAEAYKLVWWNPIPDKEAILQELAARVAGNAAGPHLRKAWRHVSEAIAWSPELPSYYTGPYYLGPAHPMCADLDAKLPDVFYGRYLFMAEMVDAEGLKLRPTFVTSPTGNVPVFGKFYRQMESLLRQAVDAMDQARPLVPERCLPMFNSEDSAARWFYHTARTEANFYESCQLRDELLRLAALPTRTPEETEQARTAFARWRMVLLDEKANAESALPVMEADMRLDFYYGGDHSFPHSADMIRAKLELLDHELNTFLPALATRCGLTNQIPTSDP
ncbi:MAG: hypothetical protein HY706_22215 [Candidatus Hydrogenedentes bacterium]|nr:hypothetical protein [Candidatus Hydrogenedentota bacterium]